MSNVLIERIHEAETGALSLRAETERVVDAIRRRAFHHFLARGGNSGSDLDDWLRAERELIWSPGAELMENDKELALRVHAPGFEPGDIKITVTPDSVLIEAEAAHRHEKSNGKVHFCEFTRKSIRRFDLPEAINVDKVSATLDKGILQVVAAKAQAASKGRTVPVTARANAAA